MDNILELVPAMKTGDALLSELTVLPEYDEGIRSQDAAVRLVALSDLYRVYIPSPMTTEIYSKLYLALLRSLQNKMGRTAIIQRNQNHRAIQQREYSGILGGADSFTIIGNSGIGKSSAISRSINLLATGGIIKIEKPHTKIIPCLVVQCPFDSSVKGLLLEILRKVDEELNTTYSVNAQKARTTTDMLVGSVSSVCLNHIGLLVVDEIQNVVASKNGRNLIGALTQLINNSGISICMVGTPDCTPFFEQAMQLARRSVGLQYHSLPYDRYFCNFCCTLFQYQYTRNKTDISDAITEWLYEHSGGIISIVVVLVHDAQEIAILSGAETLNLEMLNEAYKKRLSMLHPYIAPTIKQKAQTATVKKKPQAATVMKSADTPDEYSIASIAAHAKADNLDIVELLKGHITIDEVAI